jgi:hypothetical protein
MRRSTRRRCAGRCESHLSKGRPRKGSLCLSVRIWGGADRSERIAAADTLASALRIATHHAKIMPRRNRGMKRPKGRNPVPNSAARGLRAISLEKKFAGCVAESIQAAKTLGKLAEPERAAPGEKVRAPSACLPIGIRIAASCADQAWYLKTLPPFITNAIWRRAAASAR